MVRYNTKLTGIYRGNGKISSTNTWITGIVEEATMMETTTMNEGTACVGQAGG